MKSRSVAVLLLFLGARAAYAQSELRFTSHVEIHSANADATAAASAVSAADSLIVVSDRGRRTESHQTVPAGFNSTVIQRSDGTILLEETTKTYFRTPAPGAPANPAPQPKSDASYTRTGEFTTIAGIRAERVAMKVTIEILDTTGAPRTIETTGDVWVTDKFSAYTTKMMSMGSDAAGAVMFGAGGFPLRTVIRGGIVGPNEIDVTVTSVAEEPFQPELLEPPPDYRERTIGGGVK